MPPFTQPHFHSDAIYLAFIMLPSGVKFALFYSKSRQFVHNSRIVPNGRVMFKVLHKLMPTPEQIAAMKIMRLFGQRASAPQLWQINRRTVSKAIFIGTFFGTLPLPFHSLLILFAAVLLRVNLPISLALSWLMNPFTILPILYTGFWIGTRLFQMPMVNQDILILLMHQLADWITTWGQAAVDLTLLKPLMLGLLIEALILASSLYLLTHLLWRWQIIKRWQKRSSE